ncbi:DUF2913 family protein [Klebsiella pneumoniae]|uniref:DUF2913 family protein n=1 Tax=Klebsiella pneumoniae TaxID=573 RepID=UPI0018C559F8|nr:DUF2913 family protein [Klebsiella pneumoniae]MBG2545991.1 DUF2913 family protein [Klebsiella pneumoniae]MDN0155322.1 DUF2913 family protein [Klebsiella pneumoniae]HBY4431430.1 DUF2913 family protein [Klebsiella pneumoniae]
MLDTFESQTTDQLGYFAWCALVALGLARQEGKATNQVSEHVFISNWLNKAWKDKRFPKSTAPELTGLIKRARAEGIAANLEKVLYALFKKCTRSIIEQSELFRLNFAIDGFKRYGWNTILTTARDWKVLTKCDPSMVEGNALIIDNKSLYSSFNDSGYLLKPLELKVFGDKAFFINLLKRFYLPVVATGDDSVFLLTPERTEYIRNTIIRSKLSDFHSAKIHSNTTLSLSSGIR